MTAAADRHLLLGLLALQTGIIDQGQLVAAFQAWTLDKIRSLADILVARGDLNAVQRTLLEGLATGTKSGSSRPSTCFARAMTLVWLPVIKVELSHRRSLRCGELRIEDSSR